MKLNDALIPHYICATIPMKDLKEKVLLSQKYLQEKPTWYEIDDKLKYFKVRNDYRLFTEQFFSKFGSQILGLDTLDYQIASVRTSTPEDINGGERKIGLLSDNFQNKKEYNYYLVSELLDSEISDLVGYGYSLQGMLDFFKQKLDEKSYKKCKDFLIKLFIADSFLMQLDRNPYNIGFQVPKIPGINYKQRLREDAIIKSGQTQALLIDETGYARLKGFSPSKVYDNERILGVDHKNVLLYNSNQVWSPIWPYKTELLFENQEQALEIQNSLYDGMDPNLVELFINYPESENLIDRLANDDEYKKILEEFARPNSQVSLQPNTREYFENVMSERKETFKKVLKLKY